MQHYKMHKKHNPGLAYMKVFEGFSHIDFTLSTHENMRKEIVDTLKNFKAPPLLSLLY